MDERPLVTIAIPSREDEKAIESCVARAQAQDYRGEIEIVVVDAMSMDATREKVLAIAKDDARVKLVDNPSRNRPAALEIALHAGSGDILVPMDPRGEYGKNHVSKCVDALGVTSQVMIAPRTAGRTFVERALSAAQRTGMALAPDVKLVGAVRRDRLEETHGADLELAPSGGAAGRPRADIVVHRAEAASYRDLFRRHFQIGRSRGRRTVEEKNVESPRALAPIALVVVGGVLALTSTLQPVTPVALVTYAFYTGRAALKVGRKEGLVSIPLAWAAYPVMHVAHGVGFGAGLFGNIRGRARSMG